MQIKETDAMWCPSCKVICSRTEDAPDCACPRCGTEMLYVHNILNKEPERVSSQPKVFQPYKHDCDKCVWVGWFNPWLDKPPMNVYLCKGKTVVIRFSDTPWDYWSATAGQIIKGDYRICC